MGFGLVRRAIRVWRSALVLPGLLVVLSATGTAAMAASFSPPLGVLMFDKTSARNGDTLTVTFKTSVTGLQSAAVDYEGPYAKVDMTGLTVLSATSTCLNVDANRSPQSVTLSFGDESPATLQADTTLTCDFVFVTNATTDGKITVSVSDFYVNFYNDSGHVFKVSGQDITATLNNKPVPGNPTLTKQVPTLVDSQVSAIQDASLTQMATVQSRLIELHSDTAPDLEQGIAVTVDGQPVPAKFSYTAPVTRSDTAGQKAIGAAVAPKQSQMRWRFWSAGALNFGSDATDGYTPSSYRGADLTLGLDTEVARGLTAGLAVGRTRSRTAFGADDSNSLAQGDALSAYASWQPAAGLFIDGLAGVGNGTIDVHRFVPEASTFATGTRAYSAMFGSMAVMQDYRDGPLSVAPYVQLDVSQVRLGDYAESGAASYNLSYAALENLSLKGSAAIRLSYRFATEYGTLQPSAALGFRHEFKGSYDQQLSYVAVPGTTYSVQGNADARDEVLVNLGLSYLPDAPTRLELTYSSAYSAEAQSHAIRAQYAHRF